MSFQGKSVKKPAGSAGGRGKSFCLFPFPVSAFRTCCATHFPFKTHLGVKRAREDHSDDIEFEAEAAEGEGGSSDDIQDLLGIIGQKLNKQYDTKRKKLEGFAEKVVNTSNGQKRSFIYSRDLLNKSCLHYCFCRDAC